MIPIELKAWAMRHHVGQDALAELSGLLGAVATPTESTGSEARVQSLVRLAELAPTWFLLDAGWAFGKQARPYLERYCHLIVAGNRVKWIEESEHDATDDLAWYLFARGAPGRPTFVPRG